MSFIDTSSFSLMTSLNHLRKNAALESKWEKRKQEGFNTDGLTERQKDNVNFINSYKEQQERHPEDKMLQGIMNKISAGSKLTEKEMQYLQSKDPILYQKMRSLEIEKKQYEEDLKRCKTKDDVQKLKMKKISASLTNIRSIENNPNIPEDKKLMLIKAEQCRVNELNELTNKFVESGEYSKLPTQAEKVMAEKELAEAERQEAEIQEAGNGKQETEVREEKESVETSNSKSEKVDLPVDEKHSAEIGDDKRTTTEIELSNEYRKIKNSKAKNAYIKATIDYNIKSE